MKTSAPSWTPVSLEDSGWEGPAGDPIGARPDDAIGCGAEWRASHANRAHALCSSYPALLLVPSSVDDATLRAASGFRSRGRVPALTWRHPQNGAALCRSAQPLTGLGERRSPADESIIAAIGMASPQQRPVLIVDCRSRAAAAGNTILGKGTESESRYLASVVFLSLANIHAVRNAFLKLHELHARVSHRAAEYLPHLHDTLWLEHISSLLLAANRCAHCLHTGQRSVLVHCSDGWDRTSQVCVLTQLLLDPHYRTLRGLATLLDKDMVHFGHKAADRLGLKPPGVASAEWSPIWLQLLDCIQQVVRQFPRAFEYTPRALAFLATHGYAGFVTTFRHNTVAELQAADEAAGCRRSTSVWYGMLARKAYFANRHYRPWPLCKGPLRPAATLQRLHVWTLHLPPAREIAAQEIAEASWCEVREPAEGAGGAAAATATAVSATAVSATVASAAQGGTVGDSAVGAPTEHAKQSAANPGVANSSPVVGEGSAEGSRAGGGGSSGSVSGGETVLVESRAGGSGGSHHGSDYGSEGSARGGASGGGAGSGACRWRLVSGRVTHATRVADQPRGDYTVYHIEVELEAPTTPVDAKSAHRTDGLSAGNGHAANANGMEAAKNGGEGDHGGIGGGGDASPSISIDLHRSPSIRMGSYSCESVRIRQLGRRYSDFSHLDASIRASGLPNNVVSHLPTLPTTFTFNKFADSVVHARRVALDRYVRALLTAPSSRVLASLPEVQAFFEEVEEDGDVVGAQ